MIVTEFKLGRAAVRDEAIAHGRRRLASLARRLLRLACGEYLSHVCRAVYDFFDRN